MTRAHRVLTPGRIGPRRRDALFPWLVALAVVTAWAPLSTGLERAVAIGAAVALAFGAATGLLLVRQQGRAHAAALRDIEGRLARESDQRADALRRQFGWVIDHQIATREALKLAEARYTDAGVRATALAEALRQRDDELRRSRQKVFELAAVDVAELRAARDEASAHGDAARAEARRATEAAERLSAELSDAREQIRLLSATLGSIAEATEIKREIRAAARSDDVGERGKERAILMQWSVTDEDAVTISTVPATKKARAVRVRDRSVNVLPRTSLREGDRPGTSTTQLPKAVAELLRAAHAPSVEALIADRWVPGKPLRVTDKRRRVWGSTRSATLRVVS